MIITTGIRKIPSVFAGRKLLFLCKDRYSIKKYSNAGQKASFRCSQVLSFTAAIRATGRHCPVQSKTKCRALPRMTTKIMPHISHLKIAFVSGIISTFTTKITAHRHMIFPYFNIQKLHRKEIYDHATYESLSVPYSFFDIFLKLRQPRRYTNKCLMFDFRRYE